MIKTHELDFGFQALWMCVHSLQLRPSAALSDSTAPISTPIFLVEMLDFFYCIFIFFRRPGKSCSNTTSLCFPLLEVIHPMTESRSCSPQIATSPRWSRAGTFVWTAKGRKSASLGPSTPACSCRLCTSASNRPSTWPYRSAPTWRPNWDSPRLRWALKTQGVMWKIHKYERIIARGDYYYSAFSQKYQACNMLHSVPPLGWYDKSKGPELRWISERMWRLEPVICCVMRDHGAPGDQMWKKDCCDL